MSGVSVETTELRKQFKDFWLRTKVTAVASLNLRVPAGTVFGLLGPNGSGKSTTLKLLTGLLHPSGGQIRLMGLAPHSMEARRRLGYLPEIASMYGYLTARETLLFYGGLFGLAGKAARRRADELLELTGMTAAANRPVGEFSKGMNRRIGLAQALVNDPDLLLLDEPTAGLDPAGCRDVKRLLKAMAAAGKTVILSSHLLADVEDICDAICILHQGRAIAEGRLADLLEQREQTRFTTDAVTAEQRQALQRCFEMTTGKTARLDHPRLALDRFFAQAVEAADSREAKAPTEPPTSVQDA